MFPVILLGSDLLNPVQQVTTHPQADRMPAVSPDGNWLAFVSDRSGNMDIWIKHLPFGSSVQVTIHQAEDYQPVWTPDGKSLIFVSKRRDAQGDLWQLNVNLSKGGTAKGKPVQLTTHLGLDQKPSVSPQGNEVVFVSDRDGRLNLWVLSLKGKKIRPLTLLGGFDPAWSPTDNRILFTSLRDNQKPHLFIMPGDRQTHKDSAVSDVYRITAGNFLEDQACWSPDGKAIAFRRFQSDTDGDGRITPSDNGTIWQKKIFNQDSNNPSMQETEIQITIDMYHHIEPVWTRKNVILFASTREGGWDVWSIPEGGLFPRTNNALDQYSMVLEKTGEVIRDDELFHAILGYQRVLDYFPGDSLWVTKALIQMGDTYRLLGRDEISSEIFVRVSGKYSNQKREAALAELKMITLSTISLDERIRRCQSIILFSAGDLYALAETWIVLGDLYHEQGDIGQSLAAYTEVIQSFPDLYNIRALAQLKIGDLLEGDGQRETARQSYLSVLREFGNVPLWRNRAGQRLLDQNQGVPEERIRAFRQMLLEVSDLPSLAAEAQLSIGRLLLSQNQIQPAIRELDQIQILVPSEEWAHAQAKILQAEAFGRLGDELKGILLLEEVINTYSLVEGGRFKGLAEETLFALLFQSAERLRQFGDYRLAEVRYRKALSLKSQHILALRGLIEIRHHLGRIDDMIDELEEGLLNKPDDPVLLYGLGLAYSYKGEKSLKDLKQSNLYLTQALEEDYRLIYPYRTIGFNYELMEKLLDEQEQKQKTTLGRVGKVLLAPLKWLAGLLPFKEHVRESGYYEKAIEALITALELNNEKENPRMEALLAQNLANNFYSLGEFGYKRALFYYNRRLSLDSLFVQPLEKAVFYERAGHCATVLEEKKLTRKYLQTSIGIYQELGRDEGILRNLKMLAFYYQLIEDYESSIFTYEKIAALDKLKGSPLDLERDYRNMAYNYHLLGEPEDVLKYAGKALTILNKERIPFKPSKKSYLRIEILGLSIPIWGLEEIGGASSEGFTLAEELTLIYGLLGQNHETLKSFPDAIDFELKRLNIFQKRKDHLAERICLNRLGTLYYKSSQFEKAWDYFLISWKKNKQKKEIKGRWINSINLGNVVLVQQTLTDSSIHLSEAISIIDEDLQAAAENTSSFRRERLILLNTLGTLRILQYKRWQKESTRADQSVQSTLVSMEYLNKADALFQDALKLAREERLNVEAGIVLKNLAETAELAGDDEAAFDYLQRSFSVLEKEGQTAHLWRLLYSMGNTVQDIPGAVLDSLDTKNDPVTFYIQAIEALEKLPVQEEGSEERWSDRQERWNLYRDYALALFRRGKAEEALIAVERGREKQTADMLARRPPRLKRERHKIVWGNLRYLRTRLQEIREKIRESDRETVPIDQIVLLEDNLQRYQTEYQELLSKMREEDRVLAYLTGVEPVELKTIQSLLDDESIALSFLIGKDRTLVWAVDRKEVNVTLLNAGESFLHERIKGFLQAIRQDSLYEHKSRELYDLILRPLEPVLADRSRILVIPDGPLWYAPLGLLWDGNQYIIEKKTVIYSPSLTEYRLAWERRKVNQEKGLVVGESRDSGFSNALSLSFKEGETLLAQEATEKAVRLKSGEMDVMQLERWILYNEQDPLTSSLVLYPDKDEDGYLEAQELFQWDARASLVVLPSPGRDDAPGLRSSLPFSKGLLYAGVPTVIYSIWPIDKTLKMEFMGIFYSHLVENSAAQALTLTQREMKEKYNRMSVWGGFQMVGFQGLSSDERILFSRSNLVETVRKSRAYVELGDYTEAVQFLEKALDMSKTLQDSVTGKRIQNEMIWTAYQGQLWGKAAQYQQSLLDEAVLAADTTAILKSARNLTVFYQQSEQWKEAALLQRQLISIHQKKNQTASLIKTYETLSFIYASARDYDQAVAWMDQVYRMYRDSGNLPEQGKALIRKGRFELEKDSYWEAGRSLSQGVASLERYLEIHPDDSEMLKEQAAAYQLSGLASEKLARYDEAVDYQEKGLALFQTLNQNVQSAQGIQYLANIYWQMGDYRQALSHQKKALELFQQLRNDKLLLMAYGTQGLIEMSLGNLVEARKSEQSALQLTENKPNLVEDRATILKNLGLIAIQERNLDQAVVYFLNANQIDSTTGYRRGIAYDVRNLGNILTQRGRPESGIRYLKRGLDISLSIEDSRNVAQCYYGLGMAYHQLNQSAVALAMLDSGLAAISGLVIPELHWRLLRQRAKTLEKRGLKEAAFTDLENAIQIVETMRAELRVEAFKQGFFDTKSDLYVDAVHLLLKMKNPPKAFDFVERAKSRNFIDMLGNQKVELSKDQGEILVKEREVAQSIEEARNRIASLSEIQSPLTKAQQEEMTYWKEQLEDSCKAYSSLMVTLQAENPELASFVTVDPWKSGKLQAVLPDSTLLLEFFLTPNSLFIWTVTQKNVTGRKVDFQNDEVHNLVVAYRQTIQAYLSADVESRALYDKCIAPVENELKDIRHIIIIPHGILHYLPFAALQNSGGAFLIDRFSLSLSPSATVLGYCMEKEGALSSGGSGRRILAFSNPDLGNPRYELPFADKEVKSLSRTFDNVDVYSGSQARESILKWGGRFDIIHFACHGEYEPETPLFSALLLSPESGYDGRLEAHEIFGLDLQCDLVTLSACETGLAKVTQGDEIIGLARSFIFAGSPSIITSLWKVDDLATAVMVKRFYRYLYSGETKAEALRKAQLLVKERVNSHPSAWAAFTLTGGFGKLSDN